MDLEVQPYRSPTPRRRNYFDIGQLAQDASMAYDLGKAAIEAFNQKSKKAKFSQKRSTVSKGVNITAAGQKKPRIVRKKRTGRKRKQTVKSLARTVKRLIPPSAYFCSHHAITGQILSSINLNNYAVAGFCDSSFIELGLAKIPTTEISAGVVQSVVATDYTGVSKRTKWQYAAFGKLTCRNNYLFPCVLNWYLVQPKDDTNNSPTTVLASVDGTGMLGGATFTDVPFYPSNTYGFSAYYKILKSGQERMQPGEEFFISASHKGVYDQEIRDETSDSYPAKNTKMWLLRIQGVLSHDQTTSSIIGYNNAGLDFVVHRQIRFKYPSPAPTKVASFSVSDLGSIAAAETVVNTAEEEKSLE